MKGRQEKTRQGITQGGQIKKNIADSFLCINVPIQFD